MKYAVVVHHDEGSAYGITVPDLPGCFSAGDSFDEALENVVEAIEFHLEGLADEGMDIPQAEPIWTILTMLMAHGVLWISI